MGGAIIMSRVDTDGDRKLSLAEVRAAAGRRYDLIESKKNGYVTVLQLGGRLVPADLKDVGDTVGTGTVVRNDQYLALVDKFFDEADARRKPGDPAGSGQFGIDELGSAAARSLLACFSSSAAETRRSLPGRVLDRAADADRRSSSHPRLLQRVHRHHLDREERRRADHKTGCPRRVRCRRVTLTTHGAFLHLSTGTAFDATRLYVSASSPKCPRRSPAPACRQRQERRWRQGR